MDQKTFESLPVAQRIQLQQRLIEQGLYGGKADGKYGAGTAAAFRQEELQRAAKEAQDRAEALKSKELDIRAIEAKGKATTAEAEAKESERKSKAAEEYERQAGSPLGVATKIGAGPIALVGGKAIGLGIGGGFNAYMNEGQRQSNETLRAAAQDRVKGLTTREGAVKGATLAGAMPYENRALRVGSRMAGHAGLGGLFLGTGAHTLADYDPDQPFYSRMADRAFGLGQIGAGSGIIAQGVKHAAKPKVSPDIQALSIINSNQLRRNGISPNLAQAMQPSNVIDAEALPVEAAPAKALPAPETSEAAESAAAKAATPGTKAYMLEQAKALGLKGSTRLSKAELADKLAEAMKTHGVKRTVTPRGGGGPAAAIAGGVAYLATPKDAQASPDSASATGRDEALTNAGIAGGTAYGIHSLAKALGPTARTALGAGGSMLAPQMGADMTDYSPEELNQARNWMARNLPSAMQFGAVRDAAEMSQVPTRGERGLLGRRDLNAAALQIPPEASQSIPQQAEKSYPTALTNRIQRMTRGGASADQIAAWLNANVPADL